MSKKKEIEAYKTVEIPHLGYTVHFKDLSELQGVEIKGGAYCVDFGKHVSVVFIQDIKKSVKEPHLFPLIAHEITHVIQNICRSRMMDITQEVEHTAYLTTYLLNELLGYELNLEDNAQT